MSEVITDVTKCEQSPDLERKKKLMKEGKFLSFSHFLSNFFSAQTPAENIEQTIGAGVEQVPLTPEEHHKQ